MKEYHYDDAKTRKALNKDVRSRIALILVIVASTLFVGRRGIPPFMLITALLAGIITTLITTRIASRYMIKVRLKTKIQTTDADISMIGPSGKPSTVAYAEVTRFTEHKQQLFIRARRKFVQVFKELDEYEELKKDLETKIAIPLKVSKF